MPRMSHPKNTPGAVRRSSSCKQTPDCPVPGMRDPTVVQRGWSRLSASHGQLISPRGRCSRSLTGLRIDSWSEKHVSDSYQYQDVLTDKDGRRRDDGEEELCLVSGRDEEGKRAVY